MFNDIAPVSFYKLNSSYLVAKHKNIDKCDGFHSLSSTYSIPAQSIGRGAASSILAREKGALSLAACLVHCMCKVLCIVGVHFSLMNVPPQHILMNVT